MVELVFVIVIIGVLASIAVPRLSGITDGAKKSSEIATMSALSTALQSANGEWSINEGDFTWGNNQRFSTNPLNAQGYPDSLSAHGEVFGALLKGDHSGFKKQATITQPDEINATLFTGPSSNPTNGVNFDPEAPNSDIPNRPDRNDFWLYAPYVNTSLTCTLEGKTIFPGDILLIDINGTGKTDYNAISVTCN